MQSPLRISVSLTRSWLFLLLLPLGGILWFCIYYLSSSHARLLADFRKSYGCFYRSEGFAEQYFSPAVKAAGNGWCVAGILLSVAGIAALAYGFWKKPVLRYQILISRKAFGAVALLWMVALGSWLWGMARALPAYDEVFSAINVAAEGPGLALRYYMLPNNHPLFNILNSLLPGDGGDKVFTGRLLSGFAHLGTATVFYIWMRSRKLPVGWAFGFTAVLLLFYPVWAFSFQARGYSIYLFCCWSAIVSVDAYFRKRHLIFLWIYGLVSFLGFAVVPAYLYWQVGIGAYALTYLPLFRKEGNLWGRFLMAQIALGAAVFLFYLPGIATSGLAAYTQNPYVTPAADSLSGFFSIFRTALESTIRYSFASDIDGTSVVYPVAFLLPLLAWPFCRSPEGKRAILQFAIFWAVFCGMQLGITRRWPFMRNMVAHCSLFAGVFLVAFYYAAQGLLGGFRRLKALPNLLTALLLLATGIHYIRFMQDHLNDLYYNLLDKSYAGPAQLVEKIPTDARVWYSDESFFPHFLLRQKDIAASHCADDTGYNYFIWDHRLEALPAAFQNIPTTEVFRNEQYVLYQKTGRE